MSVTIHLLLPGGRVRPVPLTVFNRAAELRDWLYSRPEQDVPLKVRRGVLGLAGQTLPSGHTRLDTVTVDEWRAWWLRGPEGDRCFEEVNLALHDQRVRGLVIHCLEEP